MQFSYNWLNQYLGGDLPESTVVAKLLTDHIFEVDAITPAGRDTILDVDILPNRAGDCLSVIGLSRELAAIINRPMIKLGPARPANDQAITVPEISVEAKSLCRRYMGVKVTAGGGLIGPSPKIIADRLAAAGGRAISNVVDATNYAMYLTGQPLHAFDAAKIKGGITVRPARAGETMVTLDGEEITLTEAMTVIADQVGPLALAGVKGGNRAAVDETTTEIIIESANFDPTATRRAAAVVGLRTEAVKRFENDLSPEWTQFGLDWCLAVLWQTWPAMTVGPVFDFYPRPVSDQRLKLPTRLINERLGLEIEPTEAAEYLRRLALTVEIRADELLVTIPSWRRDLNQPIDLVEEVSRLVGFDRLPGRLPKPLAQAKDRESDQIFLAGQALKAILTQAGFTEVYNRSFAKTGDWQVANPLIADRPFMRTHLTSALADNLTFNLQHTLFDTEAVKLFELGTVFTGRSEDIHLAIGVGFRRKRFGTGQTEIKQVMETISQAFDIGGALDYTTQIEESSFIIELSVKALIDRAGSLPPANLTPHISEDAVFQSISPYPRIIRDIALLVPPETEPEVVVQILTPAAGPTLTTGPVLFDRFPKAGQLSLAFRLVFQAEDRTLSDQEVNQYMSAVNQVATDQGWTVR